MKILIVSQHFYPDNFRVNEIAEALVKDGHNVTVYTSLPDYATGTVPKNCRGLKNRNIDYNGVKVKRCFSFSRRFGLIWRVLNYVSFLMSSTLKARFTKERFDLVMCYQTSPVLMANAARAAAKRFKVPFFLYCLDLWPECLKAWHVGENSPLFKFIHNYSKKMYNSADLVGVTSMPFFDYHIRVNNVPKEKMVYLPQHSEDMCIGKKQRKENDEVVFAFGGNIGSVQNIEMIVKAADLLKDTDNFRIDIYGDGTELENCKKLAKTLEVENRVIFHGRVSRDALWEEYKNADAFLLTMKQEGFIGQTVPAKLQEYMSGNRPVFASIDYASQIIKESGCGVCVASDDTEALANEMRKFILSNGEMPGAAENGRKYFEKYFTKQKFMENLYGCFSAIVSKK